MWFVLGEHADPEGEIAVLSPGFAFEPIWQDVVLAMEEHPGVLASNSPQKRCHADLSPGL